MTNARARQIALVTGAGHGIGQQIASTLAAKGFRVYGVDLRADELDSTGRLITAHDGYFHGTAFDVTESQSWQNWVNAVMAKEEAIHVLVNNAGGVAGQVHRDVENVQDEDFDVIVKIFQISLRMPRTRSMSTNWALRFWDSRQCSQ